jgi:pimeloyl-ACP methyl ester carboxylesterase
MRAFLANRNYWVHGWGLGRNKGLPDGTAGRLMDRLREIHRRHERTVSIVGWSIGGVYARELAKQAPEIVRQVICLGSPFGGEGRGHSVDRLYRAVVGEQPTVQRRVAFDNLHRPPPVPSTAIYSKTDGIAYWKTCREPEARQTDNIEVPGSHIGLVVNPFVLWATADRLAQSESDWRPFERSGLHRFLYR